MMMVASSSSSSSSSPSTSGTSVAILVSRQKNSTSGISGGADGQDGTIQLAVWVHVPRSMSNLRSTTDTTTHNNSSSTSSGSMLTYYDFLDHVRSFSHLDALLTQLERPLSVVHIACTEKAELPSSKNKDGSSSNANSTLAARQRLQQVTKLLQQLADFIDSRCNDDTPLDQIEDPMDQNDEGAVATTAAATNTSLCHVHASLPNLDETRVQSILESLLMTRRSSSVEEDMMINEPNQSNNNDEGHRLAFMVDPKLAEPRGIVRRALDLWLWAEGYYPNAKNNNAAMLSPRIQWQAGVVTSHLAMDRTAADCIHLFPPPHAGLATTVGGPNMAHNSIWGILSQPLLTKMGRRRLQVWVRQPLVNLSSIVQRQDAVECLVQNGIGRDRLRDEGLRNMTSVDLDRLAIRLGHFQPSDDDNSRGVAPTASTNARKALELLYQLYLLATQKVPLLLQVLQDILPSESSITSDNISIMLSLTDSLTTALANISRAEELAQAVLDLEAAPREFRIRSSYKPELQELQEELDGIDVELEDCHKAMQDLWQEVSGQPGSQVRLEAGGGSGDNAGDSSSWNWQFRLPNTNDSKLLEHHLHSQVKTHRILKNGVYFSTKQLRALATKKQELMVEYDRHQQELVNQAMKVAATYQPIIELISDVVAQLDVLAALAHVAAYSPHGYCRPLMTDGEEDGLGIELKGARHPCVELQENNEFIPNDIRLIFGETSFLIVTGPNMGGKSTYIRMVGCIVALAQMGAFVPCQAATINICHHILARVGAGDLQERGISTFMAEMLEASSILRTATKRSLIIIDELGRGTSTFDGYGLARAISEYIVQRIGCCTVFATHFHELTALEEQEKVVKNCHVTAQGGNQGLTFLYQVLPGPCLESFGIQVAEMANLPPSVIAVAKRKAKQLERFDYSARLQEESEDHGASAFVDRFRRLPLASILAQPFSLEEEKKRSLLQLLAAVSN